MIIRICLAGKLSIKKIVYHMCENLTCKGIEFSYPYILKITKK